MGYVFSYLIQIVLTVLMTAVFAFVLSLIVFVLAYIFSSQKKRNLNCASAVIAAVAGSVVFGLSLFAVNVFVPYDGGVDYGFSDYRKVPLINGCNLVSEEELPYCIERDGVVYVDSIYSLCENSAGVVCGQLMDDTYFFFNGIPERTNYCTENDAVYKQLGFAKMKYEEPGAFYFHKREEITVERTDYWGNWVVLAAFAVSLLVFLVFRFLSKNWTLKTEDYVERTLMSHYEKMKDKE